MKVQNTGGPQGASKTKKKSGVSDADAAEFASLMSSGAPQQSAASAATQSIVQVDALLAVQGAEDPAQGASKKRMRQRANTILDKLDALRMAMLGGDLTIGHMVDIADVVASHREKITDPALTAIMDEIDLRAQVELAKMRVALDKRPQSA